MLKYHYKSIHPSYFINHVNITPQSFDMTKKASFLTGKKTSNGGTEAYSEDFFEFEEEQ